MLNNNLLILMLAISERLCENNQRINVYTNGSIEVVDSPKNGGLFYLARPINKPENIELPLMYMPEDLARNLFIQLHDIVEN